ncbi:hypothetical protein [Streptomyces sp. R527F]|uniref:hypothetical protein n=1 Tax=Streptomyces sp. R527F TaxID=1664033 RepID=UPI001F2274E3|nr:hypothetical protein [Streptomyces sp. R527F]UIZ17190.1 hypothetical protein LZ559_34735 [Streptomyces sp. R527F]
MTATPLRWSDTAHEALSGDLNVAFAYVTPAGGAVVVSVSPLGLTDRAAGRIGFTTSLGFPRKLERILRDPRVALAYHTRVTPWWTCALRPSGWTTSSTRPIASSARERAAGPGTGCCTSTDERGCTSVST